MNGDDLDEWIDATLKGWDLSKEGWRRSEFDDIETGPPLSADELEIVHEDLGVWRSPLDFRRTVARLRKRCLSSEIFAKTRQKFLLDAFTLAEFVRHKTVDQVRLKSPREEWPDGYVRLGQKVENVEVTVALTEGRRMADEYRRDAPSLRHDPVENWVDRANGIPSALEKAITKKLKRGYGSRVWLVVYLNIGSVYLNMGSWIASFSSDADINRDCSANRWPPKRRNMLSLPEAQAMFCLRRHQPRRPPLAKIRPGRPTPAMGARTLGQSKSVLTVAKASTLEFREIPCQISGESLIASQVHAGS
jgi:hypothetical protein